MSLATDIAGVGGMLNKSMDVFGLAALGLVVASVLLLILLLLLVRPVLAFLRETMKSNQDGGKNYRAWAQRMAADERATAEVKHDTVVMMGSLVGALKTIGEQTEVTAHMLKDVMRVNERVVARLERVADKLEQKQSNGGVQ